MFSKSCEYGIRATLFIAGESAKENRTRLKEIAVAIGSPEAFTAKILQQLVRHSIIDSLKGPAGGFMIDDKKRKKISLAKIVSAIDGDHIFNGCALGLTACNETKPCPVHDKFKKIREDLRKMMEETGLDEMTRKLQNGTSFLKR